MWYFGDELVTIALTHQLLRHHIEIPITNEKERQTYYGPVNLYTQECVIQATSAGNSESTVAFLKYLQSQNAYKRIVMIWDGASYHRSQEVKDYLALTNRDLDESGWKITCIRFAPNDPKQNPIEDIWLHAKRFIREFYSSIIYVNLLRQLSSFLSLLLIVKSLTFPKLFTYGLFSQLI